MLWSWMEVRAFSATLGLLLDHKPEQLVQPILEAVAFRVTDFIDATNGFVPMNDVYQRLAFSNESRELYAFIVQRPEVYLQDTSQVPQGL